MEKIVIIGEEPLQGTIAISGSKNASLPLMAASILTDETITLNNTHLTLLISIQWVAFWIRLE